MSDLDSFLEAVRAEPDDDTPRLVLADWLDEQGDSRGEFIRFQCELARWVPDVDQRIRLQTLCEQLLSENQSSWLEPIQNSNDPHWIFSRGFLIPMLIDGQLLEPNPWLQSLRLRATSASGLHYPGLLEKKRLRWIHTLDLATMPMSLTPRSQLIYRLEKSGVLHLDLAHLRSNEETALHSLPGWPWQGLRSLRLDGTISDQLSRIHFDGEPPAWFADYCTSQPEARSRVLVNSLGMKFHYIPAGSFYMGSSPQEEGYDGDEFRHRVSLTNPFYLGIYPVTQSQFAQVMGENPSQHNATNGARGDHPVEMVTWHAAEEFCRILSNHSLEVSAGRVYRLPTEAEWEYACRSGSNTRFSFGDRWTAHLANILHQYQNPLPVGSFPPNAFGIYDMHGQVREWCQDWYQRDYYHQSPEENPTGPEDGENKVLRGGSWDVSGDQYARSAYRVYFSPTGRLPGIGFRVVCEYKEDRKVGR